MMHILQWPLSSRTDLHPNGNLGREAVIRCSRRLPAYLRLEGDIFARIAKADESLERTQSLMSMSMERIAVSHEALAHSRDLLQRCRYFHQ